MIKATAIYDTVIRLAEQNPDNRASCKYFNLDGTPCCIVGHALSEHGITLGILREVSSDLNQATGASEVIYDYGDFLGIEIDLNGSQATLIDRIQGLQDSGKTWGAALGEARSEAEDRELLGA